MATGNLHSEQDGILAQEADQHIKRDLHARLRGHVLVLLWLGFVPGLRGWRGWVLAGRGMLGLGWGIRQQRGWWLLCQMLTHQLNIIERGQAMRNNQIPASHLNLPNIIQIYHQPQPTLQYKQAQNKENKKTRINIRVTFVSGAYNTYYIGWGQFISLNFSSYFGFLKLLGWKNQSQGWQCQTDCTVDHYDVQFCGGATYYEDLSNLLSSIPGSSVMLIQGRLNICQEAASRSCMIFPHICPTLTHNFWHTPCIDYGHWPSCYKMATGHSNCQPG